MEDNILEINKLAKRYGRIQAVSALSLNVPKGSVFGILGPNGSGKTTTLGILLGVLQADSGSFKWFGESSSPDVRKRIGAILERPLFYPYLSAVKNLKIVAEIKGKGKNNIEKVLQQVGLLERKNDSFRKYSLGMKQRLAIAAALLSDPEVLLFDEPTNGLDPQGIVDIRELIISIAAEGKTVLLASHLLDEVQKVCTHVAILKRGKLLYSGKIDGEQENELLELASDDLDKLQQLFENHADIIEVKRMRDKLLLRLSKNTNALKISRFLHENNIFVTHQLSRKVSLEQKFLDLLKD